MNGRRDDRATMVVGVDLGGTRPACRRRSGRAGDRRSPTPGAPRRRSGTVDARRARRAALRRRARGGRRPRCARRDRLHGARGWWSARPAPGCPTSPTSTASTCGSFVADTVVALPTVVANDAHLALLGEACEGAAAGRRDALLLAIGTGIGSAVLADGRIQRGSRGGGVLVRVGVRRRRRRRRRPARLARTTQRRAGARRRRRGDDPAARRRRRGRGRRWPAIRSAGAAVDAAGTALGTALAGAVALVDPGLVIVSGGLADAVAALEPSLRRALDRHLPPHLRGVEVTAGASRPGSRAGRRPPRGASGARLVGGRRPMKASHGPMTATLARPDRRRPEPLWHQVEQAIRAAIDGGGWEPGRADPRRGPARRRCSASAASPCVTPWPTSRRRGCCGASTAAARSCARRAGRRHPRAHQLQRGDGRARAGRRHPAARRAPRGGGRAASAAALEIDERRPASCASGGCASAAASRSACRRRTCASIVSTASAPADLGEGSLYAAAARALRHRPARRRGGLPGRRRDRAADAELLGLDRGRRRSSSSSAITSDERGPFEFTCRRCAATATRSARRCAPTATVSVDRPPITSTHHRSPHMPDQYLHRLAAPDREGAGRPMPPPSTRSPGASPIRSPAAAWSTSTAPAIRCCRARRRSPATAAMSASTR